MTTLDTLCVRLEAEAGSLFQDLDTLEHRLTALRGQSGQRVSLPAELEMRLSVTADEAIAGALRGAGDTLSAAVQGHDVQLGGALAEASPAATLSPDEAEAERARTIVEALFAACAGTDTQTETALRAEMTDEERAELIERRKAAKAEAEARRAAAAAEGAK